MLNVKLNNIEIKVKDKTNKSYDDFYHSTFFQLNLLKNVNVKVNIFILLHTYVLTLTILQFFYFFSHLYKISYKIFNKIFYHT